MRAILAWTLLTTTYVLTWALAKLGAALPRRSWKPTGRILVTGTFHNPNWYLSHVTPLALSGVREVLVVTEGPQIPLDRVKCVTPPRWVLRLFGRTCAKTICLLRAGLRYRPDLYMGYYIVPAACLALIAGRLLGRPVCYQMTGGPTDVLGGGCYGENSVARHLRSPSALVERLALAVVRNFDLVVVRGQNAERFLRERGHRGRIATITGALASPAPVENQDRDIDIIFVGRLSGIKQPLQFVRVVATVCRRRPETKAVVLGEGDLMEQAVRRSEELAVRENIQFLGKRQDVNAFLTRSKVFLLTSRSEGLSIAMAEAMAAGVVPVVPALGELAELVRDGQNGFLVGPNQIDEYSSRVLSLLEDEDLWLRCHSSAIEAARERCGLDRVADRWKTNLTDVIESAAGCKGTVADFKCSTDA